MLCPQPPERHDHAVLSVDSTKQLYVVRCLFKDGLQGPDSQKNLRKNPKFILRFSYVTLYPKFFLSLLYDFFVNRAPGSSISLRGKGLTRWRDVSSYLMSQSGKQKTTGVR